MYLSGISLGVLNEAILSISGHDNFFIFWKSICQNIKWIIPAKKVCIMLLSDDKKPQTIMQYEAGKILKDNTVPTDNLFYQHLIYSKKESWIENYHTDDQLFDWLSNQGKSIVLSIPLISDNVGFGVLLITTNSFSNDDKKDLISALNLLSCHIVTNYRLIKIIETEKETKKNLEKFASELSISEAKYKELLATQENKIIERTGELISEKEKLSNLFMNSPAIIATLIGNEHIYEFSNLLHDKFVGNRDILGKSIREAVPELIGQGFYEILDQVYVTGKPFIGKEMEMVLNQQDKESNQVAYLNLIYQPIFNENQEVTGISAFAYDVTEQVVARKQVEKLNDELLASEAKYKSLAKSLELRVEERTAEIALGKNKIEIERNKLNNILMDAPAVICLLEGPEHIYRLANPLYQKITGYRPLIGKPIREALPELEGQGIYELLDKVYETGQPFIGNEIMLMVDTSGTGKLEELYLNFTYQIVLDETGKIEGIIVFAFDVTNTVKYRQEIEKLYTEVKISNETLQSFAYIASHDLQAPLRAVRSYTELLARRAKGKFNEEELEFMDFITEGTKRMQLLISSLLEYSKIGSEKIEYTQVDLNKIVEIAIADLSNEININQASIIFDNLPTLKVEQNHILRLFENLISNALKYRSDKNPEIKIVAKKENDHYLFLLSDNGIGISERDQNKVFEIFQRLNYKENVEGTGIGLANCRKIVELHGGKIWVESVEGEGSTFIFTIPFN